MLPVRNFCFNLMQSRSSMNQMKTFALIAASFGLAATLHAGETAAQQVEELLAKGNHTDLGPTPAAVSSNEAQRLSAESVARFNEATREQLAQEAAERAERAKREAEEAKARAEAQVEAEREAREAARQAQRDADDHALNAERINSERALQWNLYH
jgi:hypothetical protein